MENDFLIKIDALEDQVHQLLQEIDEKDAKLKDRGYNPRSSKRSNANSGTFRSKRSNK